MIGQRVWKLIKALGHRTCLPSSTRIRSGTGVAWSCIAGPGGMCVSFQEHLRHADIQTTTVYTRVTQAGCDGTASTRRGSRPTTALSTCPQSSTGVEIRRRDALARLGSMESDGLSRVREHRRESFLYSTGRARREGRTRIECERTKA
jgi:hypothetical protein